MLVQVSRVEVRWEIVLSVVRNNWAQCECVLSYKSEPSDYINIKHSVLLLVENSFELCFVHSKGCLNLDQMLDKHYTLHWMSRLLIVFTVFFFYLKINFCRVTAA